MKLYSLGTCLLALVAYGALACGEGDEAIARQPAPTSTRYVAPPALPDWITATPWPTFTPFPTATLRSLRTPVTRARSTVRPTDTVAAPVAVVPEATRIGISEPTPTLQGAVIFPTPEGCSDGPIGGTRWELTSHHFFASRDLKIPFELDGTTHVFYRDANPRRLLWVLRFNYPEDEPAAVPLSARWSQVVEGEPRTMLVWSLDPLEVAPDIPGGTVELRRVTGMGEDAPGWWGRGFYLVDLWTPLSDCPLAYHPFEVK